MEGIQRAEACLGEWVRPGEGGSADQLGVLHLTFAGGCTSQKALRGTVPHLPLPRGGRVDDHLCHHGGLAVLPDGFDPGDLDL